MEGLIIILVIAAIYFPFALTAKKMLNDAANNVKQGTWLVAALLTLGVVVYVTFLTTFAISTVIF